MTGTDAPRFELSRVFEDGEADPPEVVPVLSLPQDARMQRRGFLGLGLVFGGGVAGSALTPAAAQTYCGPDPADMFKITAHRGKITTIALSPDGNYLASASEGEIKIWSLADGQVTATIDLGKKAIADKLEFGADSLFLMSQLPKGPVRLWSVPDGKPLFDVPSTSRTFHRFIYTAGTNLIVTATDDEELRVSSAEDGQSVALLQEYRHRTRSAAISSDGRFLASHSRDGFVSVWSLPEGERQVDLHGHDLSATELAFSPNNRLLVTTTQSEGYIWRLSDGEKIGSIEHDDKITKLAFRPKTGELFSWGWDETLRVWSVPEAIGSGEAESDDRDVVDWLLSWFEDRELATVALRTSPSGSAGWLWDFLATADDRLLVWRQNESNEIHLWSLDDRGELHRLSRHWKDIRALEVSNDGQRLYAADEAGVIVTWDLRKLQPISALFDPAANKKSVKAMVAGSLTLPCGCPIPAGYTCTCNCVPGTYVKPSRRKGTTICTCDTICTCIPVCQAHKLLDPDPVVRAMAEQILLIMGKGELEYMAWAADGAVPRLGHAIRGVVARIRGGETWDAGKWPAVAECIRRLDHSDEVIALMAAQMLQQWDANGRARLADVHQARMSSILERAPAMHWRGRAGA